ncbi:MAG: helix-turn-helix transcriptional regulator [Desulfuromonadales bacterium]
MKVAIGQRLKSLRTMKGLTQKELASRISGGLDYTYIGKIERDEQLPSLKILLGLSEALEVSVGYFFHDSAIAEGKDLYSAGLGALFMQEKGPEMLRALRRLHSDDLPLVTEIIKVLNRHRIVERAPRKTDGDQLRAAEAEDPYNKTEPE